MSDGGGSASSGAAGGAAAAGAASDGAGAAAQASGQVAAQAADNKGTETETITGDDGEKKTPDTPKKHRYADRLSKAFPDRQYASDEDYDKAMDEHLDRLEGYEKRGTVANQNLISLFEAEPWVGHLVRDMIAGASGRIALARHAPIDDLTPQSGDPDYAEWEKAKKERADKSANNKKFEDEYAANLELSQAQVTEFAKENNLTDEQAQEFLEKFDNMLAEIHSGKITKETLAYIRKAHNYDKDLEAARGIGAIADKNKQITAKNAEEKPAGDGLPRVSSSSTPAANTQDENYMGELIGRIGRKQVL